MSSNAFLNAVKLLVQPLHDRLDNIQMQMANINSVDILKDVRRAPLKSTFLIQPPPSFSGSIGSISVWIDKLEQSMLIRGYTVADDKIRCIYLESNLSGPALAMFSEIKHNIHLIPNKSYQAYITELKNCFPDEKKKNLL